MFKTAIAGCGAISKTHAEALKLIENTEIRCLCDTNTERALARSEEYGGKVYSDFDEMLENEEIDVLHICTPHYLHVPMAIKALKKGINVLMEKPIAISYEQFYELKKALDASNGKAKLGICFQNRYNASFIEAKRLLDEKAFGELLGARAIVTWARGEKYYTESGWRGQLAKEGGGVLINQSIHTLDLATCILGTPQKVTATASNFHLQGIIDEEDTITAYLDYGDKNVVFYATTAACKDTPIILEFICTEGRIRLESNTLTLIYPDGRREFTDNTVRVTSGKQCWGSSHTKLISDFYHCIETGDHFPVTLDTVVPSFKTMMAIYESARCGKTKTIGENL